MLLIHSPEREAIHGLSESVIIVEEFNGSSHIEDNLRVLAHVQSVDSAWHLSDVVTWLALQTIVSVFSRCTRI